MTVAQWTPATRPIHRLLAYLDITIAAWHRTSQLMVQLREWQNPETHAELKRLIAEYSCFRLLLCPRERISTTSTVEIWRDEAINEAVQRGWKPGYELVFSSVFQHLEGSWSPMVAPEPLLSSNQERWNAQRNHLSCLIALRVQFIALLALHGELIGPSISDRRRIEACNCHNEDGYERICCWIREANAREQPEPEPPPPPAPGDGERSRADDFAELRQFASNDLKGQERAVVEALCNSRGELPIADLAVANGVGWQDSCQGFKDVQRRLNPKLKKQMFSLSRQNNAARLELDPKNWTNA